MGRGKARPGSGHRVQRSGYKSKLHQESERARPSERLRQEGKKRSAQGQTRAERSAVKAEKVKLRMGAAQEKLAAQAPVKPPGPVKRGAGALGWGVHGFVHGKVYEVEHENVGTEGAHHSELVGEAVGRKTARTVRQAVRDHPAKAAARAERRYVKATAEHRFQTELEKHPDLGKNALARFAQKQRQKRQYAKQAREAAKQGAKAAEKTAVSAEKLAEKVAGFVKRHPGGVVIALACVLLLFTVQSCASSLATLGNGIIGGIGASTYPAQDGDMLGAEAAYCALEAELQHYLDTYEKELSRGFISQMLRNPIYAQADLELYEFFKGQGAVVVNEAADFAGTNGCYLYQGRDVQERKNKELKNQILVLAPSEGIVPADTWLRCRKKLMANITFQGGRKPKNTWLAGKMKCGHCGRALKSMGNRAGTQYLRCTKRADNMSCEGCGTLRTAEFEQFVYEAMVQKLSEFQTLTAQAETVNPKLTALNVELAQVEDEIEKLLNTLTGASAVLMSYANGKIEELDTRRQGLIKEIAALNAESVSPQKIEFLSAHLGNWDNIDFDDRRQVADIILSQVHATADRVSFEWKI